MFTTIWGHFSYFYRDFSFYLILLAVSTLASLICIKKLFKAKVKDRLKKPLLLIIFIFLSVVYVYSGFEAYFRYRFDQSDSLGFLQVTQRWYGRHVTYNNYQYRDNKDYTPLKPNGVVRIGVMGDSLAFGYGIKNINDRFSNILENKLNNRGFKVQVYNFGVPGFDTEQEEKEFYKRDKQFNVDILLWEYFPNDIEVATESAGQRVLKKAMTIPPGIVTFLSQHSFFFDYIFWRLNARYATTFRNLNNADLSQYFKPDIFNHHLDIINSLTKNLEKNGKKVVVIIFPFLNYLPNYPAKGIFVDKRMDEVFTQDGAVVVNMLSYLSNMNGVKLMASPYDYHPNEYVHNLAAEKLYSAILPLLSKDNNGNTILKQ